MARPKKGQPVQRDVVFDLVPKAIAATSGNHQYEFGMRQLFYAVRPDFNPIFGKELNYTYFGALMADYENANGRIESMYRDDRGALYVPHSGEWIPLGTRSVRKFERPGWTFNKLIYIEKGGFASLLQQSGWAEKNDCAIAHSGGYATGAVRDLFDLLGETDEPLTFYCVHDADGYGTRIYQALVEETRARPGRKVEVINLGLDPDEAIDMGLPVEDVDPDRRVPAADYLEPRWHEWFQEHRVELNAMTSPQFIAWLDSKLAAYTTGKVIPPEDVLADELKSGIRSAVEDRAIEIVRERVGFDDLVAEEEDRIMSQIEINEIDLEAYVAGYLHLQPLAQWSDAIRRAVGPVIDRGELPANDNADGDA